MRQFGKAMVRFAKREDGPTTVEYAVIVALVVVVCVVGIVALGGSASGLFTAAEPAAAAPDTGN